MAAGVYNFICEQGATFARSLLVTDSAGDPLDLTGYTARMQIRRDIKRDTTMLSLTTENGRITLGGEAGTIGLYISDEDTATIPRSGVYDLEIISSDGTVTRVLKGKFELDLEVTR